MTRKGGRIVLIGHHTQNGTLLSGEMAGKDLLGSGVGYDPSHQLFLDAMAFMCDGRLPVGKTVTHKVPYTEGPGIYDMLIRDPSDVGTILLEWDR